MNPASNPITAKSAQPRARCGRTECLSGNTRNAQHVRAADFRNDEKRPPPASSRSIPGADRLACVQGPSTGLVAPVTLLEFLFIKGHLFLRCEWLSRFGRRGGLRFSVARRTGCGSRVGGCLELFLVRVRSGPRTSLWSGHRERELSSKPNPVTTLLYCRRPRLPQAQDS